MPWVENRSLFAVDEKPCREADPTCEALSSALEKSDCQQSVETAPQGSKQPSKPPEATRFVNAYQEDLSHCR